MMKKKGDQTRNKDAKRPKKMMKRNGEEFQSLKATTQMIARTEPNLNNAGMILDLHRCTSATQMTILMMLVPILPPKTARLQHHLQ